MRDPLLRYTQALMTQVCQTAVCNRHHSIDQQLSRWLLLSADRVPARELVVTQELIAGLLGVRRESITEAAGKLQLAGCIRYPPRAHRGAGPGGAGVPRLRVLRRGAPGMVAAAGAGRRLTSAGRLRSGLDATAPDHHNAPHAPGCPGPAVLH